jgi:hypothetical protein
LLQGQENAFGKITFDQMTWSQTFYPIKKHRYENYVQLSFSYNAMIFDCPIQKKKRGKTRKNSRKGEKIKYRTAIER